MGPRSEWTLRNRMKTGAGLNPTAVARGFWQGLAGLFILLAAAGAALPLLPTTPFLLLAAWAAARGSPRLYRWLHEHPRYGPLLRDWQQHRALRPRVKRTALLLIAASWLIMLLTVPSNTVRGLASLVMVGVAIFLATRPERAGTD